MTHEQVRPVERVRAQLYLFVAPPKGSGDGSKLELSKPQSFADRTIELD
jgi:hypothetical protein